MKGPEVGLDASSACKVLESTRSKWESGCRIPKPLTLNPKP